jgi:hypothetical protein
MEIKEIVRSTQRSVSKDVRDDLMKKARKEHSKMVKGKFEFLDANGGFLEFNYRIFPEDMLVTYKFMHGEVCEIGMGLVKHLNNTIKKIRHFGNATSNEQGNELPTRGNSPSTYTTSSRVRFTPVDFL